MALSSPTTDLSRLHASNTTLDMSRCVAIGDHLTHVRTERGLSVDAISGKLLLSVRQVRALESADVSAFHNATFFMAGLRKYAALCGMDRAIVDAAVLATPDVVETADHSPLAIRDSTTASRGWESIVAMLIMCAVVGVGWGVFRWSRTAGAYASRGSSSPSTGASDPSEATGSALSSQLLNGAPTPPASGQTDTGTPPPDATMTAPPGEVPAAAPPSRGVVALNGQIGYGSLWSPQRAWMFLRLEDDTVIERTVNAGELVELANRPRYLAVGSDEAELTIGLTPIDVSRFVQKGTLRMGVAEFSVAERGALSDSVPAAVDNGRR